MRSVFLYFTAVSVQFKDVEKKTEGKKYPKEIYYSPHCEDNKSENNKNPYKQNSRNPYEGCEHKNIPNPYEERRVPLSHTEIKEKKIEKKTKKNTKKNSEINSHTKQIKTILKKKKERGYFLPHEEHILKHVE